MLKAIKRAWKQLRAEGHESLDTPAGVDAAFALLYGETFPVGTLRLHDRVWTFEYAPEFKSQSELQPLIDFPDLDKIYESQFLWPFFSARIPSVAQPEIRQLIETERLDEHSDVQLLRRFGERTIANPFVLR